MDKDHAKQSEKEQMQRKVCKLTNKSNLCRNQCQRISRGMFQNKEIFLNTLCRVEFLKLHFLDRLGAFRTSGIYHKLASLKSKDKKKFSKVQQLCQNILIDQGEESKITKKLKYQVLLAKMKVK